MVKKEVEEYIYEHPWEVVTEASLRKYPNRWCPQVQRVETMRRTVDNRGRLLSRRLFQGTNPVPSWLHWLIGSEPAYAVEDSVIDPQEKTMVLRLSSLSLRNWVEVDETCTYRVHHENPNWTVLRQEWSCRWKEPSGMISALENLSVERFRKTVANGRQAVKEICDDIERAADSVTLFAKEWSDRLGDAAREWVVDEPTPCGGGRQQDANTHG
ncbi:slowmo homolog 2 isoform 2 [Galdieria sulphuraria]|uniref:Slowmo homolog 2 isoform 1 n=1 Tax=Galdieria sulphuraria TaxID=130081 RepID=M2Y804_GALSU|nr:slowmo homolog 2 isoform 1 [Galdieria sulphuraria]XP_005708723.1 slowmo homolog 2 isoform 2 [Galdieria sulphuraria]EME32202.1 slowmo homolog 2 isoform 1 [Galdieria sulphuraria]EME32203.1 slowmo homolog 2 isoform 2 [Galdieria sulphuraria]|eukprot:XP_005708722.1 slowmo homolog 2 isoform 1 [Galdieria sulphuraria]